MPNDVFIGTLAWMQLHHWCLLTTADIDYWHVIFHLFISIWLTCSTPTNERSVQFHGTQHGIAFTSFAGRVIFGVCLYFMTMNVLCFDLFHISLLQCIFLCSTVCFPFLSWNVFPFILQPVLHPLLQCNFLHSIACFTFPSLNVLLLILQHILHFSLVMHSPSILQPGRLLLSLLVHYHVGR